MPTFCLWISSRSLPPALSRLSPVIEGQQTGFRFFAWKRLRIASQVWKITVDHSEKWKKHKGFLHNSGGENYSRNKVSGNSFLGLVLVLTSFHQTWFNFIKRVLTCWSIPSFSVTITLHSQILHKWLKVKNSTKFYSVLCCIEAMYVGPSFPLSTLIYSQWCHISPYRNVNWDILRWHFTDMINTMTRSHGLLSCHWSATSCCSQMHTICRSLKHLSSFRACVQSSPDLSSIRHVYALDLFHFLSISNNLAESLKWNSWKCHGQQSSVCLTMWKEGGGVTPDTDLFCDL